MVLDGGCHTRESAVRARHRLGADDVAAVWRAVLADSGEEMDVQEADIPAVGALKGSDGWLDSWLRWMTR